MADLAVARLLHVLTVVLWIGGVAMVTMVVLPAARAASDPEHFMRVERLFAAQTRWTILLAGASGLYCTSSSAWDFGRASPSLASGGCTLW